MKNIFQEGMFTNMKNNIYNDDLLYKILYVKKLKFS